MRGRAHRRTVKGVNREPVPARSPLKSRDYTLFRSPNDDITDN